jgi:hypothetical protein
MAFLKTEYGEAQLEFFLEAQKMETLDPATKVYKEIHMHICIHIMICISICVYVCIYIYV